MSDRAANLLHKVSEAWRDVMALYGKAMCSAQILERELVQTLAFLRTRSGELKHTNFDWAYLQMMRMKPNEVLNWIRGSGGNLSQENQETIRAALRVRNFLAHEFFHKYNPLMSAKQCKRIAAKLQKIDSDSKAAFELLEPLRQNLELQLGLASNRHIVSENFRKRVVEAFESFNDE